MTTTGTKRRCPGCGRTNIGRQDNCLACDTPLGREEPAPQPQTAARPKFCTACGAPLDPNNKFCTKCGNRV